MAVKKRATKKAAKAKTKKPARKTAPKRATAAKSSGPARKSPAKKAVAKAASKKAGVSKQASRAAAAPAAPPVSAATRKRNELLKKILLKKRNEVVAGLEAQIGRRLTRETGQRIDAAMDSADLSSQDMDQGIDYSLLEMKYEQYKDIADAFRKLQNNTFGLCEECGEEIDIKRLQVNPLARFCITCKTQKEEIERIQKEETRFKE